MDLSRISIVCYGSCYALVWGSELARLRFAWAGPLRLRLVLTGAGWLAHTLQLAYLAWWESHVRGWSVWSNWHDWALLGAWVLIGAYLGLAFRRGKSAIGLFLLPTALLLLAVAHVVRDWPPFSRSQAVSIWQTVHGGSLLLGTVGVFLGFASGLMYLIHSYRLRHRILNSVRFQLPSLEWLQRFSRETLWISTAALAVGLLAGVVLNLSQPEPRVMWMDLVVVSSALLLVWLLAVCVFEALYKPARQGRKVAYLTLANFVFLGIVLLVVLWGGHGQREFRQMPADGQRSEAEQVSLHLRIWHGRPGR